MAFRRSTSPITFEAFLSADSEAILDIPDSEDDLDDTGRAAKRRRVEELGKAYLEGKPLFILSAGLRGPFGNDWVNPWKQPRGKKSVPRTSKKHASQKTSVRSLPLSKSTFGTLRTKQATTQVVHPSSNVSVSESPPSFVSKEHQHELQPIHAEKSGEPSSGYAPVSHEPPLKKSRSNLHDAANEKWLKRNEKILDHRDTSLSRSPSPTTVIRQNKRGNSQNRFRHYVNQDRCQPLATAEDHTLLKQPCFTPINSARGTHENHVTKLESLMASESAQELVGSSSAQYSGSYSREPGSVDVEQKSHYFTKPAMPASILTKNGGDKYGPPRSLGHSSAGNASQKSHSRFETGRTCQEPVENHFSPGSDICEDPQRARYVPGDGVTENKNHHEGSFLYNAVNNLSKSTSHGHSDKRSKGDASEDITSAQIISGNSKFQHPILSLNSTAAVETATSVETGSQECPSEDMLSTQAGVANAQRYLQADLATSIKESPEKFGGGQQSGSRCRLPRNSPVQPAKMSDASLATPKAVDPANVNLTYNTLTVKKSKNHANDNNFGNSAYNNFIAPQTTLSALDKDGHDVHPSQQHQKTLSNIHASEKDRSQASVSSERRVENESSLSSFTALPFTLTGSTTTTRQQDGQGILLGIDDFDLSQAIADAGSFLQSWDIERDINQTTQKSGQSSSNPSFQPALSVDGGH